ncbi:hypothetical protein D623_10010782 [Myotis brandtii]|uniref:Uncharacterized protein n=1 Tax=Myotis brandtii TaxID=109478 RepID=S7PVT3_MYOBR|nr:hypothetical protein D623_10010782 [Myotis brandtii]
MPEKGKQANSTAENSHLAASRTSNKQPKPRSERDLDKVLLHFALCHHTGTPKELVSIFRR